MNNSNTSSIPDGKIAKITLEECIFDKTASYFECLLNNNTLVQCVFSDFAGWD